MPHHPGPTRVPAQFGSRACLNLSGSPLEIPGTLFLCTTTVSTSVGPRKGSDIPTLVDISPRPRGFIRTFRRAETGLMHTTRFLPRPSNKRPIRTLMRHRLFANSFPELRTAATRYVLCNDPVRFCRKALNQREELA